MSRNKHLRYAEASYWNQRYEVEPSAYEWFYGYKALKRLIRDYIPKQKLCLQVGCGNSNLAENLAKRGYKLVNVTNMTRTRKINEDSSAAG
jgi:2-polyprenyl-3-methyl-5-hydroxy-6-metoxy-1,4-benzoquinol methylase